MALGRHTMKAWRDYGRGSSSESGIGCCRTGRPFSEDAILHSCMIEVSRSTMTTFIRERLRPISLPRGRCLDRSDDASDGEVKAPRAVAGSLSWIARQCRPDEAGTASTLQDSVSRAVVKDLSDANRGVKRLKQTEGGTPNSCDSVGQPPHSVHFGCSTRLGSSRPFDTGRLHGRFHHVRAPPTRISSHVTHVLGVAQSETKCVCFSGWRGLHDERRVGRMRMDQRCVGVGGLSRLRPLISSTEINIIARRAPGDRHEGGQPFVD